MFEFDREALKNPDNRIKVDTDFNIKLAPSTNELIEYNNQDPFDQSESRNELIDNPSSKEL